jgi:copper homeostasis protein
MSIVSTREKSGPGTGGLLEVVVVHPRDVEGADAGGADRLLLVADVEDGGRSPEPELVSAVCRESDAPVRVMLRLNDGLSSTGGEVTRLAGLGEEYLTVGAEGVSFGFIDADNQIDVELCHHLADRLAGAPWTFHQAFDAALDPDRAWRQVTRLPGLDAVLSAGSSLGMDSGYDELTDRASVDPEVARLLLAGGGLRAEHVPWLVRAGVRQFQVGSVVRPGGSWTKAYVDAGHVRAWRMLLDDAVDRALGRSVG